MLETATIENVRVLPADVHNQTLVSHVHPPDWVNPEPAPRYNLVVIGAGTAGLVTAVGAAGLGARVALVEKHLMGGDCVPKSVTMTQHLGFETWESTCFSDRRSSAVLIRLS